MSKSQKIVAIGGGEIAKSETLIIDREIVRLARKKRPKILFIPTASGDSQGYFEIIQKHFGDNLGCQVDVLKLIKTKQSDAEIKAKILGTDIVYVGGGNTLKMLRYWKKYKVDLYLRMAWEKGVVLSGLSAGSICWFNQGSSDSRKFRNPDASLIKIKALGFIPALHSPHFDVEIDRRPELKEMMHKTAGVAIALDNCAALEIINDKYRVIASSDTANAYKVYWKRGKYYEGIIEKSANFRSLKKLLNK